MQDESAVLSGTLEAWPSKDELAEMFRAAGFNISVGRYAIRLTNFDHFVFHGLGGDLASQSIAADADTVDTLSEAALKVSEVLRSHDLRHRFEIYGPDETMASYFHHRWPAAD